MDSHRIKRRQRTVRVSCDHLTYIDEEGNTAYRSGQWVEFQKKLTASDMAEMLEFASLAEGDDLTALRDGLPKMLSLLARKLVAWNWVDLEGEYDEKGDLPPLPAPSLEVLSDLDFDDVLGLVGLLTGLTEPKKN